MTFENENDHHWQCQQSLTHKICVPFSIFGSQDLARYQGFQSLNEKFVFFIVIFYIYLIFNRLSIFLLNLMPLPRRGAGKVGRNQGNAMFSGGSSQSLATDRLSELQPFGMLNPMHPKPHPNGMQARNLHVKVRG